MVFDAQFWLKISRGVLHGMSLAICGIITGKQILEK